MTKCKDFPYDMGNAGDLIKHGVLALFVQWWCENNRAKTLRFADPFGGCPQTVLKNDEIKRRLNKLATYGADANGFDGAAIAECLWDGTHYYNSGNIVCRAANKYGMPPKVWTSDECPKRREKLKAAEFCMLNDEQFDGYQPRNGYSILPHAGKFDLVLLDPFGNLVRDNIHQFQNIHEAARNNPKTAIMVFVLDMQPLDMPPESTIIKQKHDRYIEARKKLSGMAFSLRCRKAIPTRNDKTFDAEILLISQTFANGGRDELCGRLKKFSNVAKAILAKDTIMWAGK